MYLIFLETRIIHLHFPADSLCLSSFNFFSGGCHNFPQDFSISKRGGFGRSRSSKVDKFGANRKCICDFLLVRNSNFGPILHRFGDLRGFMCSWPHPYSTLILGVFPLTRSPMLGINERRDLKLFGREIIFEEFQPMWSRYLIVTEGQTDGQTDRQTDNLLSHHRALR